MADIDPGRRRVPRRVLVAVAGALTLAAAALTLALLADDRSGRDEVVAAPGGELHLMTQDRPGDAYPGALLGGTLVVTADGCVAIEVQSQPPRIYNVYWAHGFTAVPDASGRVGLIDAAGRQVGVEGAGVRIGGGLMPDDWVYRGPDHPCAEPPVWGAAPDVVTELGP